jgi:DNA-binding MarR family transcriptional regulator
MLDNLKGRCQMESKFSRLIYEMSLRVRVMKSSLRSEKRISDLTERETLLIELLGSKSDMSISEICELHPQASASTISTTITKLWKEKGLLTKTILPENQRVTIVNLTKQGRRVLKDIKAMHIAMYSTIEDSLGMTAKELNWLSERIEKAIGFFDQQFDTN